MTAAENGNLESAARPLLELMQSITGLETTVITQIDWDAQEQDVLFALNCSDLVVSEGSSVAWSDSMCRAVFLSDRDESDDVQGDFPGSLGAEALGMKTFFAVPILAGDETIGTVCGASRRNVKLDPKSLGMMRLVAQALAVQVETEMESRGQRDRADRAEVLAMTDALTGLANRRAFTARWEEQLASSGRHKYALALLMIDLDDFKLVNDDLGHPAGDQVLRAVADSMRVVARAEDVLARMGGDEFAIVAPHTDGPGAELLAARLQAEVKERFRLMLIPATLSIGISATPTPRVALLTAADAALYAAKHGGRNRVEVFAP